MFSLGVQLIAHLNGVVQTSVGIMVVYPLPVEAGKKGSAAGEAGEEAGTAEGVDGAAGDGSDSTDSEEGVGGEE